MSELGDLLKSRREGLNKTHVNVRDAICINPKFIKLIEEGRFAEMPSYLHSFGFVKKYSQYLGFNYDNDIKPLFDKECPKDASMESENVVVPHIDNPVQLSSQSAENKLANKALNSTNADKVPFNSGRVIIISVIVLIVAAAIGFGIYYVYNTKSNAKSMQDKNSSIEIKEDNMLNNEVAEKEESDNIARETTQLEIIEQGEVVTEAENQNAADNSNQQGLFSPIPTNTLNTEPTIAEPSPAETPLSIKNVTFRFRGQCWVQYTSDTGENREVTANAGDRINISFNNTFSIVIGNAGAVSMIFEGKTYSRFGEEGRAKRITYKYENGELRPQN